jgi:hypothetical protein
MEEIISKYFYGSDNVFLHNFCVVVEGLMGAISASVADISRSLSKINDKPFRTNEKLVNRLLQDADFQVNDNLFRKYINLLFDIMVERGLQKLGDNILIKVDYTTDTDDFLILMACVDFGGRSVPLCFSMRSYPKRKGQSDQKKMERAFLRELRHVLSKKYTYTIVADRGFGNDRFAQLCVEFGFNYVLRIRDNLNLTIGNSQLNLKDFSGQNKSFTAHVCAWEREANFEVKTQKNSTWFIFSSLPLDKSFSTIYQKRFGIEKCFQDQKSSGFNIEKTKIQKYDRFKRLYFTMCLAQLFTVVLGEYITNENHPLKKKFPVISTMLSVFSSVDGMFAKRFLVEQSY